MVLERRLGDSLAELNPSLPTPALDDAFRKFTRPEGSTVEARNRSFHRMLVEGVTVEYRADGGAIRGAQVQVVDFDNPANNDWLAVNQFTVTENGNTRRPDVVLFVNGLPLGVIELKNPADEDATIWTAWQQLQTYKAELPTLFSMNEALMVSDGTGARIGTLTSGREWFKPWRTITGEAPADTRLTELQVMLEGVFEPGRCLAMVRDFIVFDDDGSGALVKKMAGYHQFHAVRVAVDETLRAAKLQRAEGRVAEAGGRYEAGRKPGGELGDRRMCGVVWHTQGSGKSLTMAFYARGHHPRAGDGEPYRRGPYGPQRPGRPTLRTPSHAARTSCASRRPRQRAAPTCEPNSQSTPAEWYSRPFRSSSPKRRAIPTPTYRIGATSSSSPTRPTVASTTSSTATPATCGTALPNASFVGFTGTPIELQDANTRAVFGDYISIYDIQRSVEDGATVPIYYESRLAKLALDEHEKPNIDPEFEEATEGEEVERRERLKTKWAQLEAVVGSEKRVNQIAEDIVSHFERRLEALDGKAMVVCMSRRICIDLYRELVRLRPGWHNDDDDKGSVKVVMTGSASDALDWQPHIRNKARREGAGEPVPKSRRPPPDCARARHVAHRVRRSQLALHVRGQANAGPRADAGHRPGEPCVQGQAGRSCGGLPGTGPGPQDSPCHLHRERGHGADGTGPGRSGGGYVGKA